jgi:hypothetical protein
LTDHVFTGHYASVYQEGRDAAGRHLGEVEPGEIRDLDPDALPDHQWREATDEDRERWAAVLAHRERAARRAAAKARGEDVEDDDPSSGEGAAGGIESTPDPADVNDSGTGEGEPGPRDETPAGPQPAAPAVIPGI